MVKKRLVDLHFNITVFLVLIVSMFVISMDAGFVFAQDSTQTGDCTGDCTVKATYAGRGGTPEGQPGEPKPDDPKDTPNEVVKGINEQREEGNVPRGGSTEKIETRSTASNEIVRKKDETDAYISKNGNTGECVPDLCVECDASISNDDLGENVKEGEKVYVGVPHPSGGYGVWVTIGKTTELNCVPSEELVY
tara:strand:- start:571 stop:1149 length:579 start_codon:yes stop_codon:yes gene_type:complete